jgi:hypothetical protein
MCGRNGAGGVEEDPEFCHRAHELHAVGRNNLAASAIVSVP